MTLAEKVALCAGRDFWTLSGAPRLGVPSIMVADGPYGVRKQRAGADELTIADNLPATCFPTSSALAATWSPALVEEVGVALGEEARAEGIGVLLGPGANIKRTPLCGRNFEYFSEDPLLSARLATAWIRGVQRMGVGASLKHLAANNQESRRYSIDALVDERALREIYLASFEEAVVEGRPWTVMTAYNRLNGQYCGEHQELLGQILRQEWGFDGVVLSDWGATNDRVASLAAGLDIEMPGYGGRDDAEILDAVESGRLPVETLDRAAERVLTLIARATPEQPDAHTYDREAHHALARRVATEATVLLKNADRLLPLDGDGLQVAVIGAFAKQPRFQGAGSSTITPHRVDDAYTAIAALLTEAGLGGTGRLVYAAGYRRDSDALDQALLDQACEAVRDADVVLVFAGLNETYEIEGVDRPHLRLPPSHDALISAVAEAHDRVAVVLSNGAPVEMPWHDRVSAIVEGYLGGQAGGSAIAAVLFGAAEPGGRLAETFPHRWQDNPAHALPIGPRHVEYRESVYVGYRYYDTAGAGVLFPFGHGLSYTTFAYSGLTLSAQVMPDTEALEVSVTVTNTGERAGSEVVQVYVHDVATTVFRPSQELKAFTKVWLEPRGSTRITIVLDRRAFAYYDVDRPGWTVEPGVFEIRVGASSRDIRQTAIVDVTCDKPPPRRPAPSSYRDPASGFDRDAFAALYGRPLPDNVACRHGQYTLNTPLTDMCASPVARLLLATARRQAGKRFTDRGSPLYLLVNSVLTDMSLRMLLLVSRGAIGKRTVQALLLLSNGRHAPGIRALIGGLLADRAARRRSR